MTVLRDGRKQDNFIILSAHYAAQTMPPPVILVSNDSNVQLKARAIGLQSESYRNEMVTKEEAAGAEQTSIELTPHELQGFRSKKVAVFGADSDPLLVNEYIKLTDQTGAFEFARAVSATRCVALDFPSPVKIPGGIDFRPRNPEQRCLLDALFNPEISLVVCSGKAGTGKTITAIAAALAQVLGPDARYKQLLISRAIMAMGKDVGYLPGSLEEKMKPWLQSYHDALGVLMSGAKPLPPQFQGKTKSARKDPRRRFGSTTDPSTSNQPKAYEMLTASGLVQIEALSFIRGRSIPNAIMIVDEVQNLNRHEVLSIVTRMSEGAKLVLLGDKDQIDNPFIDEVSNGLMHAAAKTRGQEIAAVIQLRKGERSKLAEMGAKLL